MPITKKRKAMYDTHIHTHHDRSHDFCNYLCNPKYTCIRVIHMWLVTFAKKSRSLKKILLTMTPRFTITFGTLLFRTYDGWQHDTRVAWTSPIDTSFCARAILPLPFFLHNSCRYGPITNINIHNISILRIAIRSLRGCDWSASR